MSIERNIHCELITIRGRAKTCFLPINALLCCAAPTQMLVTFPISCHKTHTDYGDRKYWLGKRTDKKESTEVNFSQNLYFAPPRPFLTSSISALYIHRKLAYHLIMTYQNLCFDYKQLLLITINESLICAQPQNSWTPSIIHSWSGDPI